MSQPPAIIVLYTVAVTILSATFFALWLAYLPNLPADALNSASDDALRETFVKTIVLMLAAGTLGGCLYNFRGLTKHSADSDYTVDHNLSYYLRPMSGGISGIVVFFLLLGGAITFNIGTDGTSSSWATLSERMPFIAFALLAGYGSHEFMSKLKDIAKSFFAVR